jgi:hypothetical protein
MAQLKTWRLLSEEGGRFRPSLRKFEITLKAIMGLFFFSNYYEILNKTPALRPHYVRYPPY